MTKLSERGERAARAVKVLQDARAFLTPRQNWVTGSLHEADQHGVAVRSCALGAVDRVVGVNPMYGGALHDMNGRMSMYDRAGYEHVKQALVELAEIARSNNDHHIVLGDDCKEPFDQESPITTWFNRVWRFNDTAATHEDILALFDLAIERQCKIVQGEARNAETDSQG